MKNGNYNFSNLDSNMLIAAVKKTKENLKAATVPIAPASNDDLVNPDVKVKVNPLKLKQDQVERRLNEADRACFSTKNQENKSGGTNGRTPTMSEVQKDEEGVRSRYKEGIRPEYHIPTMSEIQKDEPGVRLELIQDQKDREDHLWETLFDEPYNDSSTDDAETVSGIESPAQFTGVSPEEQRRRYEAAMKRAAQAIDDFYGYLGSSKIDIYDLTEEQKEIVEQVKKELSKQAVLGTLTKEEKGRIIRETTFYLYSNTESANGDPYPVVIELKDPKYYTQLMMPELGSIQTDGLSASDMKAILYYGRQYSQNEEQNEIYAQQKAYKEEVFLEEVERYNRDLRSGAVKVGEFQEYYDRVMMQIYENCVKPVYVKKDANGNKFGHNIPIGELIPPEDDSFGAQVARAAMQLVGLKYKDAAGQGYYSDMLIDCSALVKWAVTEVDQYLGVYGVTKKAEYQYAATKEPVWSVADGELNIDNLKPGDTLFWQGDETGEIKHTAIYIGNELMIEAQNGSVQVVGVREETHDSDGEDSTLIQVNRMTEDDLIIKAKRNEEKHG
ncbi:MAG: NlpC/P60 family protein [Eubacteriales bacterium]|jgi:hypothetical protein|nr:NlpC/P60 family protein [Eubacteriales bacterium]